MGRSHRSTWGRRLGRRQRDGLLHALTPPVASFLPTRHGPKGYCVHPLGNLSPLALDLRRERTDVSLPSRHLTGPSPGTLPDTGPSCHVKSGFEWLWEAPTRQGWKENRGRRGAESRPGHSAEGSRGAQGGREAERGKYCLYRAGDCGSLAESRARLSVRPGSWSPSESELPDRDPGLEMSKQRETQMIDLMQLIPKG